MLVGPGQPAGSGLRGQPRLYLSRARPLHTRPGGHLAGSAATAAQGDLARGGYCRAALGVPEPQPNFFPEESHIWGQEARGGESGVPG